MTPINAISAAMISVAITAGSARADAAIRCRDAPERAQPGVYWSWREIESKRCWFISARGVTPPKSAFTWAIEEPIEKDVTVEPEMTKTGAVIQMLRVKPDEDHSDVLANWLDDAPVDLIVGEDLWGMFGIGGQWILPAYSARAGADSGRGRALSGS